jgi:hypothetical protein
MDLVEGALADRLALWQRRGFSPEGPLNGVFEGAERCLRLTKNLQSRPFRGVALEIELCERAPIHLTGSRRILCGPNLTIEESDQGVRLSKCRSLGAIACKSSFDISNDFSLEGEKLRRDLLTTGVGLSDRSLILVEHRELKPSTQPEFVVAFVEVVSGAQVNVGILLGDLKFESRLGGSVLGKHSPDGEAVEESRTLNRFGSHRIDRGRPLEIAPLESDAFERYRWHAQSGSKSSQAFGYSSLDRTYRKSHAFEFRSRRVSFGSRHRSYRGPLVEHRRGPGSKILFRVEYLELAHLEEMLCERRTESTPYSPCCFDDFQTASFSKTFRALQPMPPFASRFDGQVERKAIEPRRLR